MNPRKASSSERLKAHFTRWSFGDVAPRPRVGRKHTREVLQTAEELDHLPRHAISSTRIDHASPLPPSRPIRPSPQRSTNLPARRRQHDCCGSGCNRGFTINRIGQISGDSTGAMGVTRPERATFGGGTVLGRRPLPATPSPRLRSPNRLPGSGPAESLKRDRQAPATGVLRFARSTTRPGSARRQSDRKAPPPLQSARRGVRGVADEMPVRQRTQVCVGHRERGSFTLPQPATAKS